MAPRLMWLLIEDLQSCYTSQPIVQQYRISDLMTLAYLHPTHFIFCKSNCAIPQAIPISRRAMVMVKWRVPYTSSTMSGISCLLQFVSSANIPTTSYHRERSRIYIDPKSTPFTFNLVCTKNELVSKMSYLVPGDIIS